MVSTVQDHLYQFSIFSAYHFWEIDAAQWVIVLMFSLRNPHCVNILSDVTLISNHSWLSLDFYHLWHRSFFRCFTGLLDYQLYQPFRSNIFFSTFVCFFFLYNMLLLYMCIESCTLPTWVYNILWLWLWLGLWRQQYIGSHSVQLFSRTEPPDQINRSIARPS